MIKQILAIARMEFRFAFRRSAPVVVTALIGLLFNFGCFILLISALPSLGASLNMNPEQQANWLAAGYSLQQHLPIMKAVITDMAVYGSTLPWLMVLLALLLLPAAAISAVPADRIFGVAELLHSTPLTGDRYLAGKILGVFLAVLLIWAVMLGIFFGIINTMYPIEVHFSLSWNANRYFLLLGFLDGSLYLLWGTVVGVLAGVLFRSRRAAVFPGLVAGLLSVLFWVAAFRPPPTIGDLSLGIADRLEYYLLAHYSSNINKIMSAFGINHFMPDFNPLPIGQVALMVLSILAVLGFLAGMARAWLQWKENF